MGGVSAGVPPDGRPVIDLRDVSQQVHGGELILHGISLTIRRGELVAIIGGSGTGKTTLLDTMSGLRPPVPFCTERSAVTALCVALSISAAHGVL